MCRRDQSSSAWLLVLFLLVLLFTVRTISAQEQSGLGTSVPLPIVTPLPQVLTPNWESFDLLWSQLQAELIASVEDSERLSIQLAALQTELNELRYSLALSETLYASSVANLEQERMALAQAIVERDKARLWAKIFGGAAGALAIGLTLAVIF